MVFVGFENGSPNFETKVEDGIFNFLSINTCLETYHWKCLLTETIMPLLKGFYDIPGQHVGLSKLIIVLRLSSHIKQLV